MQRAIWWLWLSKLTWLDIIFKPSEVAKWREYIGGHPQTPGGGPYVRGNITMFSHTKTSTFSLAPDILTMWNVLLGNLQTWKCLVFTANISVLIGPIYVIL